MSIRIILAALVAGLAAGALAATAAAQQGFRAELQPGAGEVARVAVPVVRIGEPLEEKAREYGRADVEDLAGRLRDSLRRELDRVGLEGEGGAMLFVTLVDATPSRPTVEQLSRRPGLSAQSVSIGGAEMTAVLRDAEGRELAAFRYAWTSPSIRDSAGRATWGDARRAFSRFARQVAGEIAAAGTPGGGGADGAPR